MKQVTAIIIGAGNRGDRAYASYALKYPKELRIVGVAEPREDRRKAFQEKYRIEDRYAVAGYEELLKLPQIADFALICTQDNMHIEPMMMAMEKGYDILVEKPIGTSKDDLVMLKKKCATYEGMLSVCHTLRYSPFFRQVKKIIDEGAIGELVNIQHMESIGFWHMAHSFVRGNWRNEKDSSPIILAKTCHDFDILLWLAGRKCLSVSSIGGLKHFTEENAPENATKRCTDGCPHAAECAYYAPRFYQEHPRAVVDGFRGVVTMDPTAEGLVEALKKGPYGRCVYYCDNDVADHQIVNMEMEDGLTISFTMSAFTNACERRINIYGTKGEIVGHMEEARIEVTDFLTGSKTQYLLNTPKTGHSGGDEAMMRELTGLIASGRQQENVTNIIQAIDGHLVAFAAEESRLKGGEVVRLV